MALFLHLYSGLPCSGLNRIGQYPHLGGPFGGNTWWDCAEPNSGVQAIVIMDETSIHWEAWSQVRPTLSRQERVPIMQSVLFERATPRMGQEGVMLHSRLGLSLNMSSTGLCLLVNELPPVGEVWRVSVPSSAVGIRTPTLADVRWTKPLPLAQCGLFAVGLKFIL